MDWASAISLLLLPIVYAALDPELNDFMKRQRSHQSKTLVSKKVDRLARASDRHYFENTLLRPLLIPRVVGTPGHEKARQHIVHYMQSLGWDIEEDAFEDITPLGKKTFTNVIATKHPKAARRLVLACHYDSKYFSDMEFIGMTDSAVPCAMLMDTARILNDMLNQRKDSKVYNVASDVTLQMIFFDGEEAFKRWTKTDSIYGARHLASVLEARVDKLREIKVNELERMDVFVLLDLIGTANPTFHSLSTETEKLYQRLQKIEKRLAKDGLLHNGNPNNNKYFLGKLGANIEDDHIPFQERKVPILHLITYPFPWVWHKYEDNAQYFDYDSTDDVAKIVRIFVAEYLHLSP